MKTACAFALCLLASSAVTAGEDPVQTVRDIYQAYAKAEKSGGIGPNQLAPRLYSERRRKEIRALKAQCRGKEFCLPDFDFFVNAQNVRISDLSVEAIVRSASEATVEARFRNFGEGHRFVFTLRREGSDWRIDQLAEKDSDADYTLDDVLKPNLIQ